MAPGWGWLVAAGVAAGVAGEGREGAWTGLGAAARGGGGGAPSPATQPNTTATHRCTHFFASHLLATHCAACATAMAPSWPAGNSTPVAAACTATTARRSAWRPDSAWQESAHDGPGWQSGRRPHE